MIIKFVPKSHYLLEDRPNSNLLPEQAQYFWDTCGLCSADKAIAAYHNGKLIGFFRYDFINKTLHAAGTWVAKNFRRKGLAELLWKKAIIKEKCYSIYVYTISKGGHALVKSVKKCFPNVHFDEHRN